MPRRALALLLTPLLLSACGSREGSHRTDPVQETENETADETPAEPEGEALPDVPPEERRSGSTGDRLVTPVCAARVSCECFPEAGGSEPSCVVGEATGASGWASHFARGNREQLSCSRRCEGEDCSWVCESEVACEETCDPDAPMPYRCEENAAGECVRVAP